MKLIQNQKLIGTIVLSENASEVEVKAATELRYYFNRMTVNPAYAKKTAEKKTAPKKTAEKKPAAKKSAATKAKKTAEAN